MATPNGREPAAARFDTFARQSPMTGVQFGIEGDALFVVLRPT
jgi:hypothetical protein